MPRRTLLRAAALGAAASTAGGCALIERKPAPPPGVDALEGLRAATAGLADRYEATIKRHANLDTRLRPLLNAHRAHLEALDRQITRTGPPETAAPSVSRSASGVPAEPAAAVAALLTAEKSALPTVNAACLSAPSWRAALLGSIVAARASHVEALS